MFLELILKVLPIFQGEDDRTYSRSMGAEDFLFHTPNGHNVAAERDFACHCYGGGDDGASEEGDERTDHGKTCAGAVFLLGARWEVKMDIGPIERIDTSRRGDG